MVVGKLRISVRLLRPAWLAVWQASAKGKDGTATGLVRARDCMRQQQRWYSKGQLFGYGERNKRKSHPYRGGICERSVARSASGNKRLECRCEPVEREANGQRILDLLARDAARRGSSMVAPSRLVSTAVTFLSSRYALAATAAWAFVQILHSFTFDTKAAINSRSPTDHGEGPRIASWVTRSIGLP